MYTLISLSPFFNGANENTAGSQHAFLEPFSQCYLGFPFVVFLTALAVISYRHFQQREGLECVYYEKGAFEIENFLQQSVPRADVNPSEFVYYFLPYFLILTISNQRKPLTTFYKISLKIICHLTKREVLLLLFLFLFVFYATYLMFTLFKASSNISGWKFHKKMCSFCMRWLKMYWLNSRPI